MQRASASVAFARLCLSHGELKVYRHGGAISWEERTKCKLTSRSGDCSEGNAKLAVNSPARL